MGVQKTSSKAAKKPSKLDSLKNLVFGSSGSSKKSGHSSQKESATKKEGTSKKEGASGKASAQDKSHPAVSAKSAVKSKGLPSSEGHKSKPVNTKKSASKGTSYKGSGRGSGASEGVVETVCREVACEGLATSGGYCRLHYIKNWKKIKRKEAILREKKLDQYIEELVSKYPDKYIEAIRQDLANDKDFAKVIHDLDLDEGTDDFDGEGGESMDSLIDTIKRDFDDDGDAF
ncbi:MAG: hypothetical protein ABIQ95_10495 [Bdellovibrionia bacterium]